jgi:hypothetical protein
VAVSGIAGVSDLPGGDVQRGEQGGDAVTGVVVGLTFGDAPGVSAGLAGSTPGPGNVTIVYADDHGFSGGR